MVVKKFGLVEMGTNGMFYTRHSNSKLLRKRQSIRSQG
jgi:hypothetical protein